MLWCGLLRLSASDGINRSALELSEVFVQLQTLVGPSVGVGTELSLTAVGVGLVQNKHLLSFMKANGWLLSAVKHQFHGNGTDGEDFGFGDLCGF